ncbi:MAG: DEAD/DEAH box helicase [Rhodospirillales bacterium]|nr:DEAD/DEAH box helicase [Rhodospirillales bacterium]
MPEGGPLEGNDDSHRWGPKMNFLQPRLETVNVDGELRPYQVHDVARLKAELMQTAARVMYVAPTGAGKTTVAKAVTKDAVAEGKRGLILVHRRELLGQMNKRLHAGGIDAGIIAAGFPARPGERVQIASVQTLDARAMRSRQMTLPPADLVVVDEAHHATADSWRRIIAAYPDAALLGLSATPCRKSGTGLGDVFKVLVLAPQIPQLIADKYLVGTKVYGPPAGIDLSGVHTRGGDYVESELAARVDRPEHVGDAAAEWFKHNPNRLRTIVFATNIAHMVHLRDAFRAQGVLAEGIDGSTPVEERDRILSDLEKGIVEVVVNVGVLTEGFDCPAVGCIVLARPTKSFGLYRQMVGRGLRPAHDKAHCIICDHVGATTMHGFAEEDVAWTLDTKTRAESKAKAAARALLLPREMANCPDCSALHWKGRPCQACGWRPQPKAKPVEVIDADLEEMRRDGSRVKHETDPITFYRQLLWIARERGYSPGWAWHKVNEKFGRRVSTPRNCVPVEPAPEVRSWVKSRTIAWAKSQRPRPEGPPT